MFFLLECPFIRNFLPGIFDCRRAIPVQLLKANKVVAHSNAQWLQAHSDVVCHAEDPCISCQVVSCRCRHVWRFELSSVQVIIQLSDFFWRSSSCSAVQVYCLGIELLKPDFTPWCKPSKHASVILGCSQIDSKFEAQHVAGLVTRVLDCCMHLCDARKPMSRENKGTHGDVRYT